MKNTSLIYSTDQRNTAKDFVLYKLGPPSEIIEKKHSCNIHRVLKKIQGKVNRIFAEKDSGRVRCETKSYKVYVSRSGEFAVVNVKSRETGRVLLSQRFRIGEYIII